jgi:cell division septation protein DedD
MSKQTNAAGPTPRAVLLRRAGVAGALIVVLLLGLAWFERMQSVADRPLVAEAPPPLPELPAGAPPMPSAAQVEAQVAAEAGLASGVQSASVETVAAPEMTAAPVVVEQAQRVDETPPAVTGAPRLVLGNAPEAPTTAAEPDAPAPAAPRPAPAKKTADAPAPLKGGYLVQLGVFSAPGNAESLAGKVDALGIPSHIESRVVVGPFRNRAEADAARKKLREAGLGKGMVVPSR